MNTLLARSLNSDVAKEILRGVAHAQNEVNLGKGINDKLLAVEIANDDNDPFSAMSIARQFVQDSEILAVVGHNASEASTPAASIYQAGELVRTYKNFLQEILL